MDSAVFGSFSITTFIDLYKSHRSTFHDKCDLLELQTNELGKLEIVTRSSDIDAFKRTYNTSYLVGIVSDSTSTHAHEIVIDTTDSGVNVFIQEWYKERKKLKEFQVTIEDSTIELFTTEKSHFYIDDYLSISAMPLNNFHEAIPNVSYTLDIHEVSWASFGNASGYGSRNKLKKLQYPRYNKNNKDNEDIQ